jgi:hypothetical protein
LLSYVVRSASAHLVHSQRRNLGQIALVGIGVLDFATVISEVVLLTHGCSHHLILFWCMKVRYDK